MSNIPETQSALTATDDKSLKVTTILTPKIENQDQVIIKVYSIAQNPTDWKSLELGRIKAGRIVRNDLAGVVVAAGSDVTHVSVGDRVPSEYGSSYSRLLHFAWVDSSKMGQAHSMSTPVFLLVDVFVSPTQCP